MQLSNGFNCRFQADFPASALTLGFYLRYIEISDEQNRYEESDGRKIYDLPSHLKFPFSGDLDKLGNRLKFGWDRFTKI